ncbi:helix-turn-helix transcriptional regulator [Leisingera sp. S132]|uniref:response regulator transcription factor n=1 Tax=Leisingera sp. S132 TaxID=2867016 RepID=UPI0021A485A2|nr:helix-turn-helix transcriptional regulator [Leisingera sp. S132]UWQ78150.1 helix-turn-helix transcriptional regulator [Leisingera sp. S132]
MKNELIDTLDRLLHPQDPGGRWQAAQDVAQRMGVKSILVAGLNLPAHSIGWVSTDMPGAWMEEYLSLGCIEIDQLIDDLLVRPGSATIECGTLHRGDARCRRHLDYNHGLKATGFGFLHCSYFGDRLGTGKTVTLCYSGGPEEAAQTTPLGIGLLSGLMASTITPDSPPPHQRYCPPQDRPLLTTRQREVLCLLAEGMMTARIAETLGLSEAAVSLHFANARKALGAATREHALALKQGLISL